MARQEASRSPAATPSASISLNDACTRCGLSLARAMLGAVARDMGGSSSFNPLDCEGEDGEMFEHDFQPRSKA